MDALNYSWQWALKSDPEQLWPYFSDTNRFNADMGLAEVEILSYANTEKGLGVKRMRSKIPFPEIEWEEYPFEWNAPHSFGVERIYQKGPFQKIKVLVRLEPRKPSGTKLVYELECVPRNALGAFLIKREIGRKFPVKLAKLAASYDSLPEWQPAPQAFGSSKLSRFAQSSETASHLSTWILQAPEYRLVRIKPYELAKEWKIPRQTVLSTCLLAAKEGILDFQWELLCPHCRSSEKSVSSLVQIECGNYCKNCQLDFKVNFDKLIELTFRPNPSVRKISQKLFCTGTPKNSPHVISQAVLAPGESKSWQLSAPEGLYLLKISRSPAEKLLRVSDSGEKTVSAIFKNNQLEANVEFVTPAFTLELKNDSPEKKLFLFEKIAWGENAVSAKDVLHMQIFRDLFSSQCLRPGERISFGSLTFVFTDLKGSTRLYQEIGDPAAFTEVINHFDILQDAIHAHEGLVVKTIGDAVMAVFTSPAQALLAVASAQRHLASPGQPRPLFLKAGIHHGPALAVTLNDKLDYFGTTVNIAARLVSLSSGNDVILSCSVASESNLSELFPKNRFESFETLIKGFGDEVFSLVRISPV